MMDDVTVFMLFRGRGEFNAEDWCVRGGMVFADFATAKKAINRDIQKLRQHREIRVSEGACDGEKVRFFNVASKGHDWVWRVKEHWIIQQTTVIS